MSKGLPYSTKRGEPGAVQVVRKHVIPVVNLSLTASAGVAAVGFGTAVVGDLPEGNILFLGGVSYLQFTTSDTDITTTWTGNYSVGTVPTADNDVADTDEANLIASATLNAATARVSPVTKGTNATAVVLNNADGSLEINLNLLVADAAFTDSQSATFTVNGTIQLVYIVLGDD